MAIYTLPSVYGLPMQTEPQIVQAFWSFPELAWFTQTKKLIKTTLLFEVFDSVLTRCTNRCFLLVFMNNYKLPLCQLDIV